MAAKHFWASFLTLSLCCFSIACQHRDHHDNQTVSTVNQEIKTNKDTTNEPDSVDFMITVRGEAHKIRIAGYDINNYKSLQEYINTTDESSLEETDTTYADVTGDGVNEANITHTFMHHNSVITTRIILQGKNMIYADTAYSPPGGVNRKSNGIDVMYDFLEPYASYYNQAFVEQLVADSFNIEDALENESEAFGIIRYMEAHLKAKHLSDAAYKTEMEKFKEYVRHFKGRFINKSGGADAWLLMWYEPEKKFIG